MVSSSNWFKCEECFFRKDEAALKLKPYCPCDCLDTNVEADENEAEENVAVLFMLRRRTGTMDTNII